MSQIKTSQIWDKPKKKKKLLWRCKANEANLTSFVFFLIIIKFSTFLFRNKKNREHFSSYREYCEHASLHKREVWFGFGTRFLSAVPFLSFSPFMLAAQLLRIGLRRVRTSLLTACPSEGPKCPRSRPSSVVLAASRRVWTGTLREMREFIRVVIHAVLGPGGRTKPSEGTSYQRGCYQPSQDISNPFCISEVEFRAI